MRSTELVGARRRVGGRHQQLTARPVELVQAAGVGAEQVADPGGGDLVERLAIVDGGDPLGQAREALQVGHALARLLVERRVLDRAGEQRRGVHEEVERRLVELARRDRVQHDHAERLARAGRDRHGHHRLEALLLQLGDVVRARVVLRVLADDRGLAVAHAPAGQTLLDGELDLPDGVGEHARRGAQTEAVTLSQVDEAGVATGGLGEQVDDAVEDAVEVGRGGDDRDDGVQRVALEANPIELGFEVAAGHARGRWV